jgi:hypothetical protein
MAATVIGCRGLRVSVVVAHSARSHIVCGACVPLICDSRRSKRSVKTLGRQLVRRPHRVRDGPPSPCRLSPMTGRPRHNRGCCSLHSARRSYEGQVGFPDVGHRILAIRNANTLQLTLFRNRQLPSAPCCIQVRFAESDETPTGVPDNKAFVCEAAQFVTCR